MNFSQYMMGINESLSADDKVQNNNNFSDDPNEANEENKATFEAFLAEEDDGSGFGDIKMDLPEKEGFANAIEDADQFANASDGQNTDIDLSFNDAFPEDNSGFEKDAKTEAVAPEEVEVDPNTIPAHNEEIDQYAPEGDEERVVNEPTAAELADDSDLDDTVVENSINDWDDLF